MNVDEIFMMDSEDVDYKSLPNHVLYHLILVDEDPFVSTNALTELSIRNSPIAYHAAIKIWSNNLGDNILKASALYVAYKLSPETAFTLFKSNEAEENRPVLEEMVEIFLVENLNPRNNKPIATLIKKRIDNTDRSTFRDLDNIENFNKLYLSFAV